MVPYVKEKFIHRSSGTFEKDYDNLKSLLSLSKEVEKNKMYSIYSFTHYISIL